MEMTKFESKDDHGFLSVVGVLRRWIQDLSQSSMANDGTMHEQPTQSLTAAQIPSDSNVFPGDGQNNVPVRGNVINQSGAGENNVAIEESFPNNSGQVAIHGSIHNHKSV